MIEEIRRRPEYELSFTKAIETVSRCFTYLTILASVLLGLLFYHQFLQYKYNVGPKMRDDPYHLAIVREKLHNRMLPAIMPDLMDEVGPAVQRHIPATGNGSFSHLSRVAKVRFNQRGPSEWVNMDVSSCAVKIVARTCNRIFVGFPVCAWLH